MSKKTNEGSEFLKNLQQAVESGDPNKGKDAIKKINEIHKLAENMDGEVAKATFEKRVEEAGEKEALTSEERELISIESEREKVRREKEEGRLSLLADIQNAEYEVKAVNKELDEITNQYKRVIAAQEEELKVLKIKYEARYGEDGE